MLRELNELEYIGYALGQPFNVAVMLRFQGELSIELLVPDFDVDYEEIVEIINHCIKLNLFEIQYGYIISSKLIERHLSFMSERKSFNFKSGRCQNVSKSGQDFEIRK